MDRFPSALVLAVGVGFVLGRWAFHGAADRVTGVAVFTGGAAAAVLGSVAAYRLIVAATARGAAAGKPRMRRTLVTLGVPAAVAAAVLALVVLAGQWEGRRAVEQGARLVVVGDYAAAVRALLPAVAAAPGDARAHYYLGLAYAGMGVIGGALGHLRDAVRLSPSAPSYHGALGRVYRDAGNGASALIEFEAATRLAPTDARYEAGLAGTLFETGRPEAALETLRRAVGRDPGSLELRLFLATTLRHAGDRDGMVREYREVWRRAGEGALGEIARQEMQQPMRQDTPQERRSPR